MSEWWADDGFWSEMAPVMYHEERLAGTAAEVDGLLSLTAPEPGAGVLDMPCGRGRHSIELARRGFRVTGVDRTEAYLAEARAAAPGAEWIAGDMRAFVRPEAFDVALHLWSSLGFFADPRDNLRVLENLASSLVPGGRALVDVKSREVFERTRVPHRVLPMKDGEVEEWTRDLDDGRVETEWRFTRGGETRRRTFRIWLYTPDELCELLADAGFTGTRVFGGLGGDDYDPSGESARRLVVLATR